MLTLCPGVDCPKAPDCERHIRWRRRSDYPFATVYRVDQQPGRMTEHRECVNGKWNRPIEAFSCVAFVEREVVTS